MIETTLREIVNPSSIYDSNILNEKESLGNNTTAFTSGLGNNRQSSGLSNRSCILPPQPQPQPQPQNHGMSNNGPNSSNKAITFSNANYFSTYSKKHGTATLPTNQNGISPTNQQISSNNENYNSWNVPNSYGSLMKVSRGKENNSQYSNIVNNNSNPSRNKTADILVHNLKDKACRGSPEHHQGERRKPSRCNLKTNKI